MAEYDSSQVAFFTVDGYSLLGWSAKLDDPGAKAVAVDRTPLGVSLERKSVLSLVEPVTITQEGWFDNAALASHEALSAKRGTSQVLAYGVTGNVIGRDFVGAVAGQSQYDPVTSKGDLHRFNASWECTEHDRGLIVAHLAARTAAGNTQATSVDNAASSAGGAVLYLACTDLTLDGYTDLVVKVRHSTDNSTYTDLGTFTARTLIGAQRLVVAGTVNRYLAISWAYTDAGTDPSWTGLVGVRRL